MKWKKTYFLVEDDFNDNFTLWHLTERFGDRSLRVWLHILAIIELNENLITFSDAQISIIAGICRVTKRKACEIIDFLAKSDLFVVSRLENGTLVFARPHSAIFPYKSKISKGLRAQVFADYRNACGYCASRPATTIDHIIPRSRGGSDKRENLIAACQTCNFSKGAKLLNEWQQN